ncbi:DUF302 domain-containing protein [Acidiferrobacter sp.]|jgi:uncharacterized protein (DUF302 family)|uniref:DUF302 domain-containing protein n=1 Tax=Acidiferrobacter sp. TaxID=1872107 RepID=UPI00260CE5F2|nr:DUF302 domain-containing protein [Acidiferrobacter sp.]
MKQKGLIGIVGGGLGLLGIAVAQASPFFVETVPMAMPAAQKAVVAALTSHHFKVVMKLDILHLIASKQKMLHIPHFNKPGFTDVRALVFCNPFLFSGLLNHSWKTASACPLDVTLYSKAAKTTVVFAKRSVYTRGTASRAVGRKIDRMVIGGLKAIPGSHRR